MKIKNILSLSILLLSSVAIAEGIKLDSDSKKVSYSIGKQIASSFKAQGIESEIDLNVLKTAITDTLADKKPLLTDQEIQQVMTSFQATMMEKKKKVAEANLVTSKAFLDKNKKVKGVITTASGLQYQELKKGSGESPKPTDTVKVHYKGTLIDGTQFDSSYDRGEPATFPLNRVIKGWTEGLGLMKVGGKNKLFISPEMAYGPADRPGIPGNSALVFEVELIEIIKPTAKEPAKK